MECYLIYTTKVMISQHTFMIFFNDSFFYFQAVFSSGHNDQQSNISDTSSLGHFSDHRAPQSSGQANPITRQASPANGLTNVSPQDRQCSSKVSKNGHKKAPNGLTAKRAHLVSQSERYSSDSSPHLAESVGDSASSTHSLSVVQTDSSLGHNGKMPEKWEPYSTSTPLKSTSTSTTNQNAAQRNERNSQPYVGQPEIVEETECPLLSKTKGTRKLGPRPPDVSMSCRPLTQALLPDSQQWDVPRVNTTEV